LYEHKDILFVHIYSQEHINYMLYEYVLTNVDFQFRY